MNRKARSSSIGADPNGIPQSVGLAVASNHEKKPVWLIVGTSPTDMPIRTLLKPHLEGGYVLLTVNVDDAVLKVSYRMPKEIKAAAVLYESRPPEKLAADSKSFTLSYEPFDTHVVRIQR